MRAIEFSRENTSDIRELKYCFQSRSDIFIRVLWFVVSERVVLGYFASNLLLLMSTLEDARFTKVANCIELNYDYVVSKE